MLQKFRSPRIILALCLVAALSVAAFADTLRLKDGSIIKGRIVSFAGGKFTVVVGEGARQRQMTYDADEIESIQFDSSPARPADTTARQPENSVRREPDFLPASNNSGTNPRVVTTDTISSRSTPKQKDTQPVVTEPPVRPQIMEPANAGIRQPIEVSVRVMADNTSNGWTNSGWVVKKGQKIRIIGDGKISLGGGRSCGPSGLYDVEDGSKLLKSVPTGALIAVIGDDNNEFIYVGSERTFTAARDGALFLGVNEGNLNDNSGTFDVRIEIEPA